MKQAAIIIALALCLTGCGTTSQPKPVAPIPVAVNPITQVLLTWNASTDTNVIGYVLDAFDSQTNLLQSLDVSNVTQAVITITNPPAKILFAAESFDGLNFSGFGLDLSGYSNFAEYDPTP